TCRCCPFPRTWATTFDRGHCMQPIQSFFGFLVLVFATLALPAMVAAAGIRSPDGRIVFTVDVDDNGIPYYTVDFRAEPVVARSRLGMRFETQHGFDAGFRVADTSTASVDRTWEQPW